MAAINVSGHILRPCGGRRGRLGRAERQGECRSGARRRQVRHRHRLRNPVGTRGGRAGVRRRGARQRRARLLARRHGPAARGGEPARRCRRSGRSRCPPTTSTCSRPPFPQAVQAAGIDPAKVIGIGTDFTACTMVPVLADGTPLCELPEYADRPHAYVKLWKHHAAQPQADRINELAAPAQRKLAAALRRADLQRVGVRQGAPAARGGPGALRADGPLGRGRRLDRLAAHRPATSATPAPPATRASTRTAPTRARNSWPR